jgi:hypothetical protein
MIALRYMGDGDFKAIRPKIADAEFVIGQVSMMEEWQSRSVQSHNHEFAWLAEAWSQLPERMADDFPSPEHLRKRALIDCGFYNETIIDVGDRAGALRVCAQMQADDEFAYVVTRGKIVVRRTAKSQKTRGAGAMERKTFQASKTAIMEYVSALIGVSPDELRKEVA